MVIGNSWKLYRKLLTLGVLSGCLTLFASSRFVGGFSASTCIQDCETQETECTTGCAATECASSQAECDSCMSFCVTSANSCYRHSTWCNQHPDGIACSDPGNCCPEFANLGNGYWYYGTCHWSIGGGGQQCIQCPPGTTCPNPNGLPPC